MSRALRRYEMLLPLRFNDGQPVPDDVVAEVHRKIALRATTHLTAAIQPA